LGKIAINSKKAERRSTIALKAEFLKTQISLIFNQMNISFPASLIVRDKAEHDNSHSHSQNTSSWQGLEPGSLF
jgi:hypothetical protein